MQEQRRGRRIALAPDELDRFLATERTCRVATVGADGAPHVSPLWFAWDGSALWLYSITRSKRWADIHHEPRISVIVDGGDAYGELIGAELTGRAEFVGPVPDRGEPDPVVDEPRRLFAEKYRGGELMADGKHAWIRLVPDKIVSWDFKKIPRA